jgi:hypothetical protein
MGLNLDVPDFSTLSRRQTCLKVVLPVQKSHQAVHVVVDSSGKPLAGITVAAVSKIGYPDHPSPTIESIVSTTNAYPSGSYSAWSLHPGDGEFSREARTDAEGRFHLHGFGTSAVRLGIQHGVSDTYHLWVQPGAPARIVVPD